MTSCDVIGTMADVFVLRDGYGHEDETGTYRANCTISLIKCPAMKINVLVDTGSPWDRDFLVAKLTEHCLTPDDVTHVVGTHGHVDHIGNLNLFTSATHIVSHDIVSRGDRYTLHDFRLDNPYRIAESPRIDVIPTPGHTGRDVSVLVRAHDEENVLIAGDLFENERDLTDEKLWKDNSECPEIQAESRRRVLEFADWIIPGHGRKFRVVKK